MFIDRLARIKAEAKRRRDERERQEAVKQSERIRRLKVLMEQFAEWNTSPTASVELSLVRLYSGVIPCEEGFQCICKYSGILIV